MSIDELNVAGYRSLLDVHMQLDRINVLVGPNGSGKSNLYRSMYLMGRIANGEFSRALADEGGMPSVLWAGPRRKGPVRLTLLVRIDELSYELTCGLPVPDGSKFELDPEVKKERIWIHQKSRKINMLKRDNNYVRVRDAEGRWVDFAMEFTSSELVLAELREPDRFPILDVVRRQFLSWRFYHQFRTDFESPLRRPQPGIRTPVLSHDGKDLAAALETIREMGDARKLDESIKSAFPESDLRTVGDGGFVVSMDMPGIGRPLRAMELSDGTLQFLCLLAVFLRPRPPTFLAVNEPEASIHENLLEPLAHLIANAANSSQIWITTHSPRLADLIQKHAPVKTFQVRMQDGATSVTSEEVD